jgi:hypothetical protein
VTAPGKLCIVEGCMEPRDRDRRCAHHEYEFKHRKDQLQRSSLEMAAEKAQIAAQIAAMERSDPFYANDPYGTRDTPCTRQTSSSRDAYAQRGVVLADPAADAGHEEAIRLLSDQHATIVSEGRRGGPVSRAAPPSYPRSATLRQPRASGA